MTRPLVPLSVISSLSDDDLVSSYDIRDFPFGLVLDRNGVVLTHCSVGTLASMSIGDQRVLLSAMHQATEALANLLTSLSEHVK